VGLLSPIQTFGTCTVLYLALKQTLLCTGTLICLVEVSNPLVGRGNEEMKISIPVLESLWWPRIIPIMHTICNVMFPWVLGFPVVENPVWQFS